MISAWHKHLKTDVEKEQFKNSVLGSKVVLRRLKEIIKEMADDQDRIERNTDMYTLPNWDYRQAHLNGFKDCLNKINKIVDLDQEENDRPISAT
jgi:hypothetical protein